MTSGTEDKVSEPENTRDLEFYNMQEGVLGRHPSLYLDEEENREAERRRSIAEGREPNYDDPGPSVGTVVVTKAQRVENSGFSNPSVFGEANWQDSSSTPFGTLPVDFGRGEMLVDMSDENQRQAEAEAGNTETLAEDDERNTNQPRVLLGSGATPTAGDATAPADATGEGTNQPNGIDEE